MPTWTAHNDFKPAAAQCLSHNRVSSSAIEHKAVGDRVFPSRRGKDVPHTPQIAFPFLSNITDKHKRQRMPDAHRSEQGGDRQHRCHTGAVVGNSGTVNAASLLTDIKRRVGGKNSVDVRAERNVAASKARMRSKDISHIVDADVV